MPRGGPSGGDGGDGGSVLVIGDRALNTLYHLRHTRRVVADRGRHGEGSNRAGKSGADARIRVPPGTLVCDRASGELLGEILTGDEQVVVAHGGRGGRGNARFATATRQAPRLVRAGTRRRGARPAASSSSCSPTSASSGCPTPASRRSSRWSRRRGPRSPTIRSPRWCRSSAWWRAIRSREPFVIADLPGLIAGAAGGAGLGIQFLQHVERCRVLVHLVDLSEQAGEPASRTRSRPSSASSPPSTPS